MPKSVMIVGVGGQGTILAGNLLSRGLLEAGYEVKVSEIVGMSQRGGSVSTQIRYGEQVASPVIELGSCQCLLAFEKMEAVRYMPYLTKDAKMIVNDLELYPMPVTTGKVPYPPGILSYLEKQAQVSVIPAAAMAEKLGNSKVMNVILLGALIKSMGLESLDWETMILKTVKPQFAQLNLEAIRLGMRAYDE